MWFQKRTNSRLNRVRKDTTVDRFTQISQFANIDVITSILLGLVFIALCVFILSFELIQQTGYFRLIPITLIVVLVAVAAAFYICHYQKRIVQNPLRTLALVALFTLLLAAAQIGVLLTGQTFWATTTAFAFATILTISYNQRFAIGMSIIYCTLASFVAGPRADINLFLITASAAVTCCFSLKEIRTRMKLIEVGTFAAVVVFIMVAALDLWTKKTPLGAVFVDAGYHAGATLSVSLLIQSLLPLIEKLFHIATSMTLLDYSDANQPLLRRLAMEAPGTFSHSLLVGSIAEAAAEAIGRNGLLCRVGAYYHDIGKINKPTYFAENEFGPTSRHKELSPAMSQLIIVGHVKDGMELAREYGLPSVLRQFIETHHGTTLVEYFYNEAKKKYDEDQTEPSESAFRYVGPKPKTKEAAIVMLADTIEGAVRSLPEAAPTKIEAVAHNMAMKRLQDGQFDECDLSLRELSKIEAGISKALAGHYHGRVTYPKAPHIPEDMQVSSEQTDQEDD